MPCLLVISSSWQFWDISKNWPAVTERVCWGLFSFSWFLETVSHFVSLNACQLIFKNLKCSSYVGKKYWDFWKVYVTYLHLYTIGHILLFCWYLSAWSSGWYLPGQPKHIFGCLWVDGFALVAIFYNGNIYLLVLIRTLAEEPLGVTGLGRLVCVNSEWFLCCLSVYFINLLIF